MKHGIIGFGCAGYHAAKEIRRIDKSARIDVYDTVREAVFSPMLSTYLARGQLSLDETFPFGRLSAIKSQLDLNVFQSTAALSPEPGSLAVTLPDGERREYDRVLVSTGANPIVPPALAAGDSPVFTMRTLADAVRLSDYLNGHAVRRAVIVGGSMVGIKIAELLFERNVEITVVDAAGWLFPLAAYKTSGEFMRRALEAKGIKFIFDVTVTANAGGGLSLKDGGYVPADIVCLCAGTRPDLSAVKNPKGGYLLQVGRGIIADERMGASCPGVYTAGDCAETYNLQTEKGSVIGLWAQAGLQGSCAGQNMAGGSSFYPGGIPYNITHFFDMDFVSIGDVSIPGERFRYSRKDYELEISVSGGRLSSANIIGLCQISGIMKSCLNKVLAGAPPFLSAVQRGLLLGAGFPAELLTVMGGD